MVGVNSVFAQTRSTRRRREFRLWLSSNPRQRQQHPQCPSVFSVGTAYARNCSRIVAVACNSNMWQNRLPSGTEPSKHHESCCLAPSSSIRVGATRAEFGMLVYCACLQQRRFSAGKDTVLSLVRHVNDCRRLPLHMVNSIGVRASRMPTTVGRCVPCHFTTACPSQHFQFLGDRGPFSLLAPWYPFVQSWRAEGSLRAPSTALLQSLSPLLLAPPLVRLITCHTPPHPLTTP